jgi:Ni/Fe-hydrogenase subunit HybB-like protein
VAVCVLAYIIVLWVEVLPSILEGAAASRFPRWASIGRTWAPRLQKAMPFIVALAVVLPVMHQSSLGGLMLLAETKVHPLWHTALLPALFLVSCLSMGFGAMVVLGSILGTTWGGRWDQVLFVRMSRLNAWLLLFYVALRVADIAWSGKLGHFGADGFTALFAVELALFLAPAVMFLLPAVQADQGRLFLAALLAVLAGALYRVDTYMSVYRPAPGWNYVPSLGEMAVTVGMAALGIGLFIAVSRLFPVVVVERKPAP